MMSPHKKHPKSGPEAHPLELRLGPYQSRVDERLAAWKAIGFGLKLWNKDTKLWAHDPAPEISGRLGWLDLPVLMQDQAEDILAFAEEVKSERFSHAVVLGMGGSSLAPDVFQKTFGSRPGYPKLLVLDSTHPASVLAVEKSIDLAHTLFIVSSKSGTTVEPLSFFRYFWAKASKASDSPGRHFAAITDPGTPLVDLARERKFRRVFLAAPDVGGRFSALTPFGLVPAALTGMDIKVLLERARIAAESNGPDAVDDAAEGLRLGAALGELGKERDKLVLLTSPSLQSFPDWLEQLIAESLGKGGKGILPIAEEPLISIEMYGPDRVFAALLLDADHDRGLVSHLASLEEAGQPVIKIDVRDTWDLGREMFLWELAVAAAGAALGVQPFDQPDVELAKDLARQAMAASGADHEAAPSDQDAMDVDSPGLGPAVAGWLAQAKPGDYIALQAYLHTQETTTRGLQDIRRAALKKTKLATTLGYGPRFLHSTGQFHKGGPNKGLFLQFVDEPARDLSVPESDYTFGRLIRSQALGDAQALRQKGRRVLRINLKGDAPGGLERVRRAI
jgi:transaldolase/glucose-6-phosphate isomerase